MVSPSRVKRSVIIDRIAKNAAALCMAGTKKNFLKVYMLCQDNPQWLYKDIQLAQRKYIPHHNPTHILKSLVYFKEAESDPMPTLFFDAAWGDMKKYFRAEVTRIARRIIGLE